MNKFVFLWIAFLFVFAEVNAQNTYPDHFGVGNVIGVQVTSSDEQAGNESENSLNGTGRLPDLEGASRFLGQATFGANYELIEYVTQIGIDAWIDEQVNLMGISHANLTDQIVATALAEIEAEHGTGNELYWGPEIVNLAFWQKLVTENDLLRQRVAFMLSQILVASQEMTGDYEAMATYYDILYTNAFGNYRDILGEVSMHPVMGLYLSHFNNPKTDQANSIRPDENYAREIMQLFSIGLYELNNDGSEKLDAAGNPIPTYDNDDIKEYAKVFTGLSGSAWNFEAHPNMVGNPLYFGWYWGLYDLTIPMQMFDNEHEPGEKFLLNGEVIPAGQTGMQDVNMALDNLFNHPNIGPFLARRFIQFLVKSNPSPAYINRVATAFNNNGEGVRGDMTATIRAVLTDPEARDCDQIADVQGGKLREPLVKYANLIRAFDMSNQSNRYWFRDVWGYESERQAFLLAPSVFNFFGPSYSPNGIVSANGMVAPEFQILNSTSGINYFNNTENRVLYLPMWSQGTVNPNAGEFYISSYQNGPLDETNLDLSDEIAEYNSNGTAALIDRLDLILCHGNMTDETKTIITTAINDMNALGWTGWLTPEMLVKMAIYFTMVSPDYTILK